MKNTKFNKLSAVFIAITFLCLILPQIAVGLISLSVDQTKSADVSGDAEVSAYDAALIAQRAVGLIDKFPVE